MKSEEIIYDNVLASPQLPPKISYKDDWAFDLDSDIAISSCVPLSVERSDKDKERRRRKS